MVSSMSQIVKRRLNEICPDESVDSKSTDELISDCRVAFEIIGYNATDLEKTVDKVLRKLEKRNWDHKLVTFIYNVWME